MAEDPWLTEDEMATWRALDRVLTRLPRALEAQLERDAGLGYMEYYVLAGLSDQPGRTIRISRLAELAHCELSRLSHLISRLERRGLVRREPDPDDRRSTRAVLTEEGHRLLVAVAPAHVALVRRLVFDDLSPAGQRMLREAADRIVTRLDEVGA
ncbi:MarR family winged helix-turn-helix transcriptional regulator [Desertihabitans brevis]|nr:MarR family transcriptional regulator [Desertihabitans brevis]